MRDERREKGWRTWRLFSLISHLSSRLHTDDRGNIGILMLLSIWALVGTLAIVWNTGEVAARKQDLQTAADTSAHSNATWLARGINLVTAQNMAIGQDASMEIIWRAVTPTDQAIRKELDSEENAVQQLLSGGQLRQRWNRLISDESRIDQEYAQLTAAMGQLSGSDDPKLADSVRQANLAVGWVQDTYVGGAQPANAQWPSPPGPGGQGLRQLVTQWSAGGNVADQAILQVILQYLQEEYDVLGQFEARTATSQAQDVPSMVLKHEIELYENEQNMIFGQQVDDGTRPGQRPDPIQAASGLDKVLTQQTDAQAAYYQAKIIRSNCDLDAKDSSTTLTAPPVIPASWVNQLSHTDSITGQTVMIDPINVQVDTNPDEGDTNQVAESDPALDAHIRFGTIDADTPAEDLAEYPQLPATFAINCDVGDGWGHLYCAPLYRYVHGRVMSDEKGLEVYPKQIDELRRELAIEIRQLLGLGNNTNIAGLPSRIVDPNPNPQLNTNGGQIDVLPKLTAPANASAELQAAITDYNQHGARYTGAVRQLVNDLENWANQYDRFTRAFAVDTWHGQVAAAARHVLKALGLNKLFMVLGPYQLAPLPDWAVEDMRTSSTTAIHDRIVAQNIAGVTNAVLRAMIRADRNGAGGGFLDPSARNAFLTSIYSAAAAQIARDIVNEAADEAAPIIAQEWVSRPWVSEKSLPDDWPPEDSAPPTLGMTGPDRCRYFTVLNAAQPGEKGTPKMFFANLMNAKTPQLLADAQAEAFNWMEFNANYGASDNYIAVSDVPTFWGYYPHFTGNPLPWRTSTVGGWNWNSRLTITYGLYYSLINHPDLQDAFNQAGVTTPDQNALGTLTLH